jgi:site-specific recombinase XerD
MRRRRDLDHPLAQLFRRSAESMTTALGDASQRQYLATWRGFLRYLKAHHRDVRTLEQLKRDPHLLGRLAELKLRTPPLAKNTRAIVIVRLRRIFEDLAWTQHVPALTHLIKPDDVPRKDRRLPRALTPEQDELIQNELRRRDDLTSNLLLLQRHTGMRLGECIDLSLDCLRCLGSGQSAILVPLGKLQTERLVPVDTFVCDLVNRIRALRHAGATDNFLIGWPRARETMIRQFRSYLHAVTTAAAINTRIVPHQFRHTYATEMLMAGVTFAGIMQLLGHSSPNMTLAYLKVAQPDLQREYRAALAHPRHLVPSPRLPFSTPTDCADQPALLNSFRATQHLLEMFRRAMTDDSTRRLLDRLGNRLTKIIAELSKINCA